MVGPGTRAIFEKDLSASWDIQKPVSPSRLFTADYCHLRKQNIECRSGMTRYLIHPENAHNRFSLINIRFQTDQSAMTPKMIHYLLSITIDIKLEIECH